MPSAEERRRTLMRGLCPHCNRVLAPGRSLCFMCIEKKAIRVRRQTKRRIRECKEFLARLKLDRGCADCGYKDHPEALVFDHLPGSVKLLNVSQMSPRFRRREKLEAEVAKCEVVCANCHAVRTASRRNAE
jgi:hypothetical protein